MDVTQKILFARDYLGAVFGKDESFQYPLHCSLTGFFSIQASEEPCRKESVLRALRKAVMNFVDAHHRSSCIPRARENSEDSEAADNLTTASDLRREEREEDAGERVYDIEEVVQCAEEGESEEGVFEERVFDAAGTDGTPAGGRRHEGEEDTFYRVCRGPLYEMGPGTMDPRRVFDADAAAYNRRLKWIKVTPDNGLVMPLDSHWFEEEDKLNRLCKGIAHALERECGVPLELKGRRGQRGIQIKRADHVSLLSPKHRSHALTKQQAFAAAQFVDQVISSVSELHWDLVVYEVVEWGPSPDDSHALYEVLRVPHVALQHSHF
ncbi:hypothetical protein GNI_082900 [Gregarina niphandrodes]|uniref:Uncharacterized protein n=1 Tax=Gregarina niphandrodes TaxID=110365 RepID=A0A023B667_GRENI|nr:hypothetical protein GNI_082900 [Gregarina niphandrodes]EZG65537.1 hypothetical protein GNI_082900 [Gregarina niphandrodes]|eukprot:XP_011134075.1 hypothetical protein GNI_082900 [Gregarina niphandrodes]